MNPMEQMAISMLGKLTGLSPEDMQKLASTAIQMLQSANDQLTAIRDDIAQLRSEMHAIHAIKTDPIMPELLTDERQTENVN